MGRHVCPSSVETSVPLGPTAMHERVEEENATARAPAFGGVAAAFQLLPSSFDVAADPIEDPTATRTVCTLPFAMLSWVRAAKENPTEPASPDAEGTSVFANATGQPAALGEPA
jgi:hypothetical protein